jgi:hypothetical protein
MDGGSHFEKVENFVNRTVDVLLLVVCVETHSTILRSALCSNSPRQVVEFKDAHLYNAKTMQTLHADILGNAS